ncbi:hypothetical protein J4414_00385 [Candidatus Woesearchaeota archaeon]|nr:hypothetical protein [Candidatus Woesearchaeota archaeon]
MADPQPLNVNALTLQSMGSLLKRRARKLEEGVIKAAFLSLSEFADLLIAYKGRKDPNDYLELTHKVASLKRWLQDDIEARDITISLQKLLYSKKIDLNAIEGKYKELCNRVLEIEDKYVGFRKRISLKDLQGVFEKTAEKVEEKNKKAFYNLFAYFIRDIGLLYKTEEFSENWIKVYKNLQKYSDILLGYFQKNKYYSYAEMAKSLKLVCDQQTNPDITEEELRKLIRRLLKDKFIIFRT